MKLSTIIITKNEEDNIEKCIKNLNFSDEIIVVDNDSNDNTADLAKKSGAKVYKISGLDFSYLRNVGKEKSSGEWLLYIDTDEKVTPVLAKEIKNIISNPCEYNGFSLPRKNYFFGREWPKVDKMVRLIKKDALIGWHGSLHETPIVAGKIGNITNSLLHYTHNDLSSMVRKTNEWSEIEAQLRYKNNHPVMSWWRFFRVMISSFVASYFRDGGWKLGTTGLIESIYQSFSSFITYAKLWEKQKVTTNTEN